MVAKRLRRAIVLALLVLGSSAVVVGLPFDGVLIDDFDQFPYLWRSSPQAAVTRLVIGQGDPLALPGQGDTEGVLSITGPLRIAASVDGPSCAPALGLVTVVIPTTPSFNAATVDHTTVRYGQASEAHRDRSGLARRHAEDADGDGDIDLVFHFRGGDTGVPCDTTIVPLSGRTYDGRAVTSGGADASVVRPFAVGQDWSVSDGLRFWYYGQNTGDPIAVQLLDNRAPDPGPGGWRLEWSDEFDGPAGASPDAARWTPEIGDGTANGIPGWGNQELQYYSNAPANAATDGAGHLAITARPADGTLSCYYGPCQYTSARLISQHKVEIGYGRIEARVQVPAGAGLWPAFWSLGTDIGQAGWPQAGEIDIMEFVGRRPTEIFGTIHGPGYSGGASFGATYDLGTNVPGAFRTFALEWRPDRLDWFVDGVRYHTARPADVAPNQWVFDKPFFMLLNLAVGGNLGGPVDPATAFPATLLVDYVRVYRAPDTAERFEASFTDDFSGWREIVLPFASFTRSDAQPAGAPDDGLTLTDVWGVGFRLPGTGLTTGQILVDGIGLVRPSSVVVTSSANDGAGSLRQAVARVARDGVVTFAPALAGATISLADPVVVSGKSVTVDGSAAPGIRVSGGGTDRVFIIDAGAALTARRLTIADGFGWQLAGGVLNNGTLDMEECLVTGNRVASDYKDFWMGGAGIYNGGGSTLRLINSTVSQNSASNGVATDGGGIYAFFGANVLIDRSTIAGNVGDVGGGVRMLGSATIRNSTLSGNVSSGWYGSAVFHTDGVMHLVNSTVTANVAPDYAGAALFVGTFTAADATMTLVNSIVAGNTQFGCFVAPFGSGIVTLTSGGTNVVTDGTCAPVASDLLVGNAMLEPLAPNGGPTPSHLPMAGSPAIDAANAALCPATDQRGVARPQGPSCDSGAVEREP